MSNNRAIKPESNVDDLLGVFGPWALKKMVEIRRFEESLPKLIADGLIYGSTHPSIGMEAIAVGTSFWLRDEDAILSTHRGHGHCLAKGAELEPMFAELFGRQSGYCSGRGGSMHLAVADLGIMGTNGIVGAGAGIGVGAGIAADLQGNGAVVVVYFGDGAINQGVISESFNLASLWKLPVLFVCEDNGYAQSTPSGVMNGSADITARAEAFGIPAVEVDGMDAIAVARSSRVAIDRARSGAGPSFIWARSYRYSGHNGPKDSEKYRDAEEVEKWREQDPIASFTKLMINNKMIGEGAMESILNEVDACISKAIEAASGSDMASVEKAKQAVFAEVT